MGDRHGDRGKIDRGIDMVIEGYKCDRRVSCSPGVNQVCTRCAPFDHCSPGVHHVCTRCAPGVHYLGVHHVTTVHQVCTRCAPGVHWGVHQVCTRCAELHYQIAG